MYAVDIPWSETLYDARSTSDHYSWYYAGYPVTHSLEGAWEHININSEYLFTFMGGVYGVSTCFDRYT